MENLFDVIGNRMFSVFASKDRRANYELLLFIYDTFTQDECSQAIEKGEMVDKFTEYIKRHSFSELDDEEGVDILAKSAKEKANFKLRQFKRCGWLEEDNSEGFSVFVSMTDNAIALMETFKNLISKRNRPLECNYGNRPVREYKKYQEQMQTDKEMYYNALVESNKILYRKKRLLRYIDKKKITIDRYEKVLMALCKAKTEEDLNAILANALNSIIHHN